MARAAAKSQITLLGKGCSDADSLIDHRAGVSLGPDAAGSAVVIKLLYATYRVETKISIAAIRISRIET